MQKIKLSLNTMSIITVFLAESIEKAEKEIAELQAILILTKMDAISSHLSKEIKDKLVNLDEKFEGRKKIHADFLATLSDLNESVEDFSKVYKHGIEVNKLFDIYKKAEKWSIEEKKAIENLYDCLLYTSDAADD